MRASVGAGGTDPVALRFREPLFGVTERQVLFAWLQAIQRWHVGQPGGATWGIGRLFFAGGFLRNFGLGHRSLSNRSNSTPFGFAQGRLSRARNAREMGHPVPVRLTTLSPRGDSGQGGRWIWSLVEFGVARRGEIV